MSRERLQKIVARAGLSSRRGAEELITGGRVRVNGRVVTELGTQADARNDRIEVDGKRIVAELFVYVLLHKPRKVVSTRNDPEGRPTVTELVAAVPGNLYPVGRLDFHTSGALLLTNDGEFTQGMLHPRQGVPKVYVAKVQGEMSEGDLDRWRDGLQLDDGMTAPCEATLLRYEGDKTWIEVTLHEGRNQQIRRMGEASGFPIMRLARLSFAGISTEGLRPGHFRMLTSDELRDLKERYGVPRRVHKQQVALDPELARRRSREGGYSRSADEDDLPTRTRSSSRDHAPAGRSDRDRPSTGGRSDRSSGGRSDRPATERSGRSDRPATDRFDRPAAGRSDRPATERADRPFTGRSDRPATGRSERPPVGRPDRVRTHAERPSDGRPTRDRSEPADERPTRVNPSDLRDQATGDRRRSDPATRASAPAPTREPYTKDRPNRERPAREPYTKDRPNRERPDAGRRARPGANDQHPNDRRADAPRPGTGPRRK